MGMLSRYPIVGSEDLNNDNGLVFQQRVTLDVQGTEVIYTMFIQLLRVNIERDPFFGDIAIACV